MRGATGTHHREGAITVARKPFAQAPNLAILACMSRTWTLGRGRYVLAALIAFLFAVVAGVAARADPQVSGAGQALAVSGFDPVAYFSDGRALAGRDTIALRWRGQRWHFDTERNRAAFEANPRAYMPAFKGLCAVGLSEGRRVRGDPREWVVHGGRLYLLETASERRRLEVVPDEVLAKAHAAWAELHSKD